MTIDDGGSALVLSSDDQLSLLRSAHVLYVDATFRVVPSLYHQLFTIFIFHAEYAFQLIVSGCWFHYAQAIIKRLRKLGLTDACRNDEEPETIFRCLLSLPLLPVGDIAPGFQELKSLLTSQSATSATMTQLLRYVEKQ